MKRKFPKATAMLLSLIFILTAFVSLPITANAATEYIDVQMVVYPRGGGTNTWGHPALTFMNGWSSSASSSVTAKAAENKGWAVAYCVQPNVPLYSGNRSPEILPENFLGTYNNGALNQDDIVKLLGRIMQYGYTGAVTTSLSDDVMAELIATQMLVWEVIVGERAPDFSHITPPSNLNSVMDCIRSDHPLRYAIYANYNRIISSVQDHTKIPSFMRLSRTAAIAHEMTWDGSQYAVTLDDTNGVLANYDFTSPTPGVSFSKNGNSLTISTATQPAGDIEISASKIGSVRSAVVFWCSNKIEVRGSVQGLVMSGQSVSDPITAYVKAKVSTGTLKITKTFEDRKTPIAGVPFMIAGQTNAGTTVEINAVTDENGEILLENLLVGNYTVMELESDLTVGYVLSPEENVVVAADRITEVNINNTLMRGTLKIVKTFEDKDEPIAGVKFLVTGKSLTGADYSGEFETGEDGCIYIEGLLVGDYTVREIESDLTDGYVLSDEQAIVIEHEKVTELQFENKLIRSNVKLVKTDKANGAKLSGAEFELYDPDGSLIGIYTTDGNGEVFIEELAYGFGYKLVEIKAPRGYMLCKAELSFDITENGATVELFAVNEMIPPKNPRTGDNSNTFYGLRCWALLPPPLSDLRFTASAGKE